MDFSIQPGDWIVIHANILKAAKRLGQSSGGCGVQCAWQVVSTAPGAEFTELQPKLFLYQALEILLKQDQKQGSWQGSWIDDTLGDIAEVQMCAGDLGGALKTILRIEYTYRRDALLFQLAETFVQRGNSLAAVGVTFFIEAKGPTYSCQDTVSLGWVQRLIEIGNLSLADKEVHKLKLAESRIGGLLKLAMVYSKVGNGEKASDYFKSAMEEARAVKDKTHRELELFTIAKFQIEAGKIKEARSLVEDLFAKRDQKSSWSNFSNCLESAELMAKMKEEKRANGPEVSQCGFQSGGRLSIVWCGRQMAIGSAGLPLSRFSPRNCFSIPAAHRLIHEASVRRASECVARFVSESLFSAAWSIPRPMSRFLGGQMSLLN